MTESEIQAAEERAQPRRETTREIARRVLGRYLKSIRIGTPLDEIELELLGSCLEADLGNPNISLLAESAADLAELLRRAASGECDRENGE